MNRINQALSLAERGYPVFTCIPNGKSPATAHGFYDATTDPDRIAEMFNSVPNANIGLATAGLVVVDIDPMKDGSPNPWPDTIREPLEPGAITRTPRGGQHWYFRENGHPISKSENVLADKVDIRANGSYIIAPGSVINGKVYEPVVELPPRDQLPVVPEFIERKLIGDAGLFERPANASTTTPPTSSTATNVKPVVSVDADEDILEGSRNGTLTSIAGGWRRIGMSRDAIAAALQVVNVERCKPPLGRDEVAGIAKSMTKYPPDKTAQAVAEGRLGQDPAPLLQTLTSEELDGGDFTVEYLCEGVVPRAQPGVIGGPSKACKTSWTVYLFLCMALGRKFLDIFDCPKPIRCGLLSAESGLGSLQGQARRIVASMGETLGNVKNLHWSPSVLDLGNDTHLAAVEKWIRDEGLEALGLDPVYLLFPGVGEASNNLYAWGKFLNPLASICQRTGCTLVLNHHFRKTGTDPFGQPELSDLSNSGIANFVRWWGLINRRTKYDPEKRGQHEFWMSFGGSAGHSSAWAVDLDEGYMTGAWNWQARPAGAARAEIADERETARERRKEERERKALEENAANLLAVFQSRPAGETKSAAWIDARLNANHGSQALSHLIKQGLLEATDVKKGKVTHPGYKAVQPRSDNSDTVRQESDSRSVSGACLTHPL
jgi:hypothetical protein